MTYDAAARDLAVTALGTSRTGMNYLYTDNPFVCGVLGWTGSRAAALLNRIRTENGSSWVGVPASLTSDLDTHPAPSALFGADAASYASVGLRASALDSLALVNETYWTCRYFTAAESYAVALVLNNNKALQNDQAYRDLASYAQAAAYAGFDLNANTDAALYFMAMFTYGTANALEVIAASGPGAPIDRYYASSLNDPVLATHRPALIAAYTTITGHTPAIGTAPDPTPSTPPDGGDTGTTGGVTSLTGPVGYVRRSGDTLHAHMADKHIVTLFPTSGDFYVPRADPTVGAPVPPLPANPDPTTPPASGADTTRAALVAWVTSRIGRYAYSQGPTRLDPEQNMYTDCSGLMYWTFQQVAGINVGTWTGNQVGHGTLVAQGSGTLDQSTLLPADLVFYNWSRYKSTYDHVDMFIGGGNVCGHGGPGSGPNTKTLAPRISNAHDYMVRRYV